MKNWRAWLWCRVCNKQTWHNEKNQCLTCLEREKDLPAITGHARKQEQKGADTDKGNDVTAAQ